MVEIYFNIQSDNGALTEGHALRKWSGNYIKALEDAKDVRAGMKLNSFMASAGLVDVESRMIPLPLSGWPSGKLLAGPCFAILVAHYCEDPRMREIGTLNRENAQRWLSSLAIYPFMQKLLMSRGDFDELVSVARQEADDASLRAYVPLYVFSMTIKEKFLLIFQIRVHWSEALRWDVPLPFAGYPSCFRRFALHSLLLVLHIPFRSKRPSGYSLRNSIEKLVMRHWTLTVLSPIPTEIGQPHSRPSPPAVWIRPPGLQC